LFLLACITVPVVALPLLYRGPSGAGKSSLLHAWAGRIKSKSNLQLTGTRLVNGKPVKDALPVALVEQEYNGFVHMTVRESLEFKLAFERGMNKTVREATIDGLLDQMGLTGVADTIVGSNKIRGISGGERKRLSIALELLSSPNIVFLDEPTSGLDSTAALSVLQTCKKLANDGKTVVVVLHQPSQAILDLIDDLMVMAEGHLVYSGTTKAAREFMEEQGCHALVGSGTAEHILDCVSRASMRSETTKEVDDRIHRIRQATRTAAKKQISQHASKLHDSADQAAIDNLQHHTTPKVGMVQQFRLLLVRSFRERLRAKSLIMVKAIQNCVIGLIYGSIYNLGTNQASIQDRIGLLSLIAIGSANLAVAASVRAFPKEKSIIATEITSKLYRVFPYLMGKAFSELPLVVLNSVLFGSVVYVTTGLSRSIGKFRRFLGILIAHGIACDAVGLTVGSISSSSDVALAFYPAIILLNVIFDGKNIANENIPRFLKFIPKIGLIRWAYEGLATNEFEGLVFDSAGPHRGSIVKTGAEALERYGIGGYSFNTIIKTQLMIAASCWVVSYVGLTLSRQRYLDMGDSEQGESEQKLSGQE
jgi:ABC-type multidrug transport system ATPase subunit